MPTDVEAALGKLLPYDDAVGFRRQVAQVIEKLGFTVLPGHIDVYARRGNFSLAIEIDASHPRSESLAKLRRLSSAYRLVLLNAACGDFEAPKGIDRVWGLAKKDLFDRPVAEKRRRPAPSRPAPHRLDEAVRIGDTYQQEVASEHRRTIRADKNIAYWLTHGFDAEQLRTAIRNYAACCDGLDRELIFRKSCENFFSRRDPMFKTFLYEKPETLRKKTKKTGVPDSAERIREINDAMFKRREEAVPGDKQAIHEKLQNVLGGAKG